MLTTMYRLLTSSVSDRFGPDNPLFFLHIFKTGGSTLRHELEKSCGIRHTQGVYDGDHGLRGRLKRYVPEHELVRRDVAMYYGHMFYGQHERLGLPANYATFLREPEARVISHHQHTNRRAIGSSAPALSLMRMIEDEDLLLDNLQTRFVSGFRDVPFGALNENHLAIALEHLAEFAFVGVLERPVESMRWLNEVLGTDMSLSNRLNDGGRGWSVDSYSASERGALSELTRFDRELYRHAHELLDRAAGRVGRSGS